MTLVTFEEAVEYCHLGLQAESPPSQPEQDFRLLMDAATSLVIRYAKMTNHPWRADTDYTTDETFAVIKLAILKVIRGLWTHRGDDEKPYDPIMEIEGMLSGYRKPTIA